MDATPTFKTNARVFFHRFKKTARGHSTADKSLSVFFAVFFSSVLASSLKAYEKKGWRGHSCQRDCSASFFLPFDTNASSGLTKSGQIFCSCGPKTNPSFSSWASLRRASPHSFLFSSHQQLLPVTPSPKIASPHLDWLASSAYPLTKSARPSWPSFATKSFMAR